MTALDPKALEAVKDVLYEAVKGNLETGFTVGDVWLAIQTYLDAADLVERSALEVLKSWRCYWCNAVFTDRAKAEIHFGKAHSSKPAPECYAMKMRELRDFTKERDEAHRDMNVLGEKYHEARAQIAALRAVITQLSESLKAGNEAAWDKLNAVLTDTEEAPAGYQKVPEEEGP